MQGLIRTIDFIAQHPTNEGNYLRAIRKFVGWQFKKRMTKARVKLVNGLVMNGYIDDTISSLVAYVDLPEYSDMMFVLRYLRSGDIFFDVGANVGIYSLLASPIVSDGKVFAFECSKRIYVRLLENIELNKIENVIASNQGIYEQASTIWLNEDPKGTTSFLSQEKRSSGYYVKVTAIDRVSCEYNLQEIALLKLDIEGAELFALRGATSLLESRKIQCILLEATDGSEKNFNYSLHEIDSFLSLLGFSFYNYNVEDTSLHPVTMYNHSGNNIIAISDLEFVAKRLEDQ